MQSAATLVRDFANDAYCARAPDYIRFRATSGAGIEVSTWGPLPYLLGALRSPNILDLGCGTGSLAIEQLDIGSYLGLDLSQELLRRHVLRDRPNVTLRVCDLEKDNLALPTKVDLVIAVLALNYIADLQTLLRTIRRDGSHFYFIIPNPAFDRKNGEVRDGATHIHFLGFTLVYHSHAVDDVLDMLEPCEDVDVRRIGPRGLFKEPPYLLVHGRW